MSGPDLPEGETLLLSKRANAVIKLSEYQLKRLPFDQLMPLVGMSGKEAIGGEVHLTSYRLVFVAHPFNRLRGKFSIVLPTITGVRDWSRFLTKKIEVQTASQTYEFVVWGIPQLIAHIEEAMNALAEAEASRIATLVVQSGEVPGVGLEPNQFMDTAVRNWLKIVQNPLDVSTLLNLLEVVGGLAESAGERGQARPEPPRADF